MSMVSENILRCGNEVPMLVLELGGFENTQHNGRIRLTQPGSLIAKRREARLDMKARRYRLVIRSTGFVIILDKFPFLQQPGVHLVCNQFAFKS